MRQSCTRCGLLHPQGSPCFSLYLAGFATPDSLQPDSMLAGRYHIVRTIHQGGMSVVYLAEDRVQNLLVAVKELRLPQEATTEELKEAETWFARESYLLSSLRHPLIPTFYSVFREEGRSYIVQEYVQGENLEDVVARQGPQPAHIVRGWGQAICELLTYLHLQQEPVVFRDLKPSNILLRPDGRLAVVDFGIARPYQPDQIGTVIGSPGYSPPEQYQGVATPQSDVYALGATLHRLLTGYDPEQGAPFTFPSVQELNPGVSLELAAVVARAVRLVPEERYPTAGAMGSALRDAANRGGDWGGLPTYPARPALGQPWLQHLLPFAGAMLTISMLGLWMLHAVQPPVQPTPYGSMYYDPSTNTFEVVIDTPSGSATYQAPILPQAGAVQPQSDPWATGAHWSIGGAQTLLNAGGHVDRDGDWGNRWSQP
ncbi:MAG TPA: serine/threonine-protein kinase [Chloroflexota bacterium]|nr:serine/threonine-protein kinase [Chloroflexota bacterium]